MTPIDETDNERIEAAAERIAAPMRKYAKYVAALEAERDALTKTNNSLVDTCNELRAEVGQLKVSIKADGITNAKFVVKLQDKINTAQSHAAKLAGALSELQDDPDWDMFFNRCFCDSLIERDRPCRFCAARAALAAYNKTQGDDTNAKR